MSLACFPSIQDPCGCLSSGEFLEFGCWDSFTAELVFPMQQQHLINFHREFLALDYRLKAIHRLVGKLFLFIFVKYF